MLFFVFLDMILNNILFYSYEGSLRAMASYVFNRTLFFAKRMAYQFVSEHLYQSFGTSFLVWAVEKNFTNLAIDMIRHGVNVNQTHAARFNGLGFTALHYAVLFNQVVLASACLDQGADLAARDFFGLTSVDRVIRRGSPAMIQVFRNHGVILPTLIPAVPLLGVFLPFLNTNQAYLNRHQSRIGAVSNCHLGFSRH